VTYVQVALNGVLLGGFYLLMAQGLNLVFGVMGIVNLAHGAFIVLGGLGVWSLYGSGVNPFLGLLVVVAVAAALGAVVQWAVIERIRGTAKQHELLTLMATFGLSYILINVGQQVWGSDYRTITFLQSSLTVGPFRFAWSLLVGVVLAAAITLGIAYWLTRTTSGTSLRAQAQSPLGAGACGINPRRLRLVGFSVGAAVAAAAGMLLVMTQPIAPQAATNFTIVAFVVIALGGLGNYKGAVVGALLVGIVQTVAGYQFGAVVQAAAPYLMLILVMLLKPAGLLSRKATA